MSAQDIWRQDQVHVRRAWPTVAAAVDRRANPLPAKPIRQRLLMTTAVDGVQRLLTLRPYPTLRHDPVTTAPQTPERMVPVPFVHQEAEKLGSMTSQMTKAARWGTWAAFGAHWLWWNVGAVSG